MGQYYLIVNQDKRQYLHPHRFGNGLKLLEFGASGEGTMLGLAILLANSNGRGSGDLRSENPIVGSWAGDRIVVAGDYGDETETIDGEPATLFHLAASEYEEISAAVKTALAEDDRDWRCLRNA